MTSKILMKVANATSKPIYYHNIGIIYIALCILLWSLGPTAIKFALNKLDHHQYLLYSSIFSYSKKLMLVLFSLVFLDFLYYLLLFFGYKHANGLEVLVIQYYYC